MTTDEKILTHLRSAELPVVVDVWAPWCGPCRAMAPNLDRLKTEYAGRVELLKVNADQHPGLVQEWQVQGIPTLLAFRGGKPVARQVGLQPLPALRQFFDFAVSGQGEMKASLPPIERILRLGAGLALLVMAWAAGGSWLLAGLGLLVAFSAVHDRCPIWQAVAPRLRSLLGRS
jgi:thioredoxin